MFVGYIVITLGVRQFNLSGITLATQTDPNQIRYTCTGQAWPQRSGNFVAICQVGTTLGNKPLFLYGIPGPTLCQLPNKLLSPNLATTRESRECDF